MKLTLTLNVNKIDKSKIVDKTFTTKDGQTVSNKEYKVELIPLKEERFVAQGDTWTLIKTHLIAEPQTKEQRDNGEKSNIIGEGMEFRDKVDHSQVAEPLVDTKTSKGYNGEVIDTADIPF